MNTTGGVLEKKRTPSRDQMIRSLKKRLEVAVAAEATTCRNLARILSSVLWVQTRAKGGHDGCSSRACSGMGSSHNLLTPRTGAHPHCSAFEATVLLSKASYSSTRWPMARRIVPVSEQDVVGEERELPGGMKSQDLYPQAHRPSHPSGAFARALSRIVYWPSARDQPVKAIR